MKKKKKKGKKETERTSRARIASVDGEMRLVMVLLSGAMCQLDGICLLLGTLPFASPAHFLFSSYVFLGLHSWHMEVPRLGVELELQLPPTPQLTATPDP